MYRNDDGHDEQIQNVDIFRETPVRYLGYSNEVGEAFRQLIPIGVVRFSYLLASTYCLSDATSKAYDIIKHNEGSVSNKACKRRAIEMFIEASVWQGLASVIIPGFTINRICWLSSMYLARNAFVKGNKAKWITTAIGLGSIPIIIKPIDSLVDKMMESAINLSSRLGVSHQIVHDEKMHVAFEHEPKFK